MYVTENRYGTAHNVLLDKGNEFECQEVNDFVECEEELELCWIWSWTRLEQRTWLTVREDGSLWNYRDDGILISGCDLDCVGKYYCRIA